MSSDVVYMSQIIHHIPHTGLQYASTPPVNLVSVTTYLIKPADVSGVQPALAVYCLSRSLLLPQVPHEHMPATETDLWRNYYSHNNLL